MLYLYVKYLLKPFWAEDKLKFYLMIKSEYTNLVIKSSLILSTAII